MCPPQRRQWTSVRVIPNVVSLVSPMALSSGCQKLGQPVPLSYLVSEENSGRSHPAQAKMPLRFSFRSGLEPGRSVPCLLRISYCCGVSCARHSASVFSISNFSPAFAGEARSQRKAARPKRLAIDASKIRRSIMMVSRRRERSGSPSNTRRGSRSYTDPEGFLSLCCEYRALDAVQHLALLRPTRRSPGLQTYCPPSLRCAEGAVAGPAAGGGLAAFRPGGLPATDEPRGYCPAPALVRNNGPTRRQRRNFLYSTCQ